MLIGPEVLTSHQMGESYNVDPEKDLTSRPGWKTSVSMQKIYNNGANYTYFEISYLEKDVVKATRNVAVILPGNHTEIAYWTEEAPEKALTVHKGKGILIIGNPNNGKTEKILIDADVDKEVFLPSGRFYTILAKPNAIEPFVISGFYEPLPDWSRWEAELKPKQKSVETKNGTKYLPKNFRTFISSNISRRYH